MKQQAPDVYVFAAYSGTGKTTYLTRLIPCLKAKGLRVAAVQHDVHGLSLDVPGTDSRRLAEAGADAVAVVSGGECLLVEPAPLTLEAVLRMAPRRIVMVSCNPATAARDVKYLDAHGYHALEIQPADLFPRTKHVEAVIMLSRKDSMDRYRGWK